jgi:hypothetical protein
MLSMSHGEEHLNHGARSTLRLKGIEDLTLLDFDVSALRGRQVLEARLYFFPLESHKLRSIGLSTVASPWKEGQGSNDPARRGESCFREAARGERSWGRPGGDFHDVSFGRGGSIWFVREMTQEADGWAWVGLPPALVHALQEGHSYGLALSDEKAQTLSNNSIYSRHQSGRSPYVAVLRSQPGTAPASGAKSFATPPPPKIADRSREFLRSAPPVVPPAESPAVDGCQLRILFEGETNPAAAPAARLWDGRTLELEGARGEHIAFQLAVLVPAGQSRMIRLEGAGWRAERILPVGSSYDPLVPPAEAPIAGTAFYYIERYIPKTASPGVESLTLWLKIGAAEKPIPVRLRVHSARLPDLLGFQISLNGYASPGEAAGDPPGSPAFLEMERAFHRLAHEHRATLAIVPYSQRGWVFPGMIPEVRREKSQVEVVSWKSYDDRWGPYFDGSAFKGLPREGVPLTHFYWPHHENWPLPINEFYLYHGKPEDHWRDAPAPEAAFPEDYGKAFAGMIREFGLHAAAKGWRSTQFLVYLNDKPNIRFDRHEPEGAWWRLDEPVSLEDHLALRYFGLRTREGARGAPGIPIRFRVDLSRPQCRRDVLDGLVGLDVSSGAYREYPQLVFGRGEDVWVYGGVDGPGGNGVAPRAWALQTFLDGADGVVPWLALGSPSAWQKPEDTALILPPRPGMDRRPYATLRLKGLRRGQQDVELLRLVLAKKSAGREEIREGVAEALGLKGSFRKTSEEDAGTVDFGHLDPDRFEVLRRSLLAALDGP